jgi:hypothetical protein
MPGTPTNHDAHLAGAWSVDGHDGATGRAGYPQHIRMRPDHPLDHLGDDVLRRVHDFLGLGSHRQILGGVAWVRFGDQAACRRRAIEAFMSARTSSSVSSNG